MPRIQRAAAVLAVFLALPQLLWAQLSSPPLTLWEHRAWTGDQGPPLRTNYIARSADGYLWLGAPNALLRFDGVSFIIIDSTTDPLLRSDSAGDFQPQRVDRNGTLWIVRPDHALIGYRDGRFSLLAKSPPTAGARLVIDGAGRYWLTQRARPIFEIVNGGTRPAHFPGGVPDTGIRRVVADTGTGLWIGTNTQGLWHVVGNSAIRIDGIQGRVEPLVQSSDGTLWFASGLELGLGRLVGSRVLPPGLPWDREARTPILNVATDSTGAVWFAAADRGVLRWSRGAFEVFTRDDGLSDLSTFSVTTDGAGGAWVTTNEGLDRLRPTPLVTLGRAQGLAWSPPDQMIEAGDGGLWTHRSGDLHIQLHRGGILGDAGDSTVNRAYSVPSSANDQLIGPAVQGGVWVAHVAGGLSRLSTDGGRRTWGPADGLPSSLCLVAHEARDGSVWLTFLDGGLGRLIKDRYVPVALPGQAEPRIEWLTEDSSGTIWIILADSNRILGLRGDSVVRSLGPADGVRGTPIMLAAAGDTLWGSSDSGLIRIAGARAVTITVPSLARSLVSRPEVLVSGSDLWIVSDISVGRVPITALNAVATGHPDSLPVRMLGNADGLPAARRPWFVGFKSSRSRNGRLLFITPAGLALFDPNWESIDRTPPVIHIQSISVSDSTLRPGGALAEVPANPDRVTLRFDAIGGPTPERISVQYRLEGLEDRWTGAGTTRAVTFSHLRPGRYVFRVRAWNAAGVAAENEAELPFRVRAAWYQTVWFAGLAVLALAGLVALATILILQRRNRLAAARLKTEYEAALGERVRIAQDLHDTLLQGLAGVSMQLSALELAPPAVVGDSLPRVRGLADQALREARDSVWDMRSPELDQNDLPDALLCKGRELIGDRALEIRLTISGERRRLPRGIEVTAFRIGREALANTVQHSNARVVTIGVDFDSDTVTLRISDDGRGIQKHDGEAARQRGHWGLVGMRERARRAGGNCEIEPAATGGTTVTVRLPVTAPAATGG